MGIDRRQFAVTATAAGLLAGGPALAQAKPKLRMIRVNGIRMRIAEMGKGPLVILAHGWPESWYSWRHQIPALAAAGYHVVAPDMRGYGGTDKPANVADYDVHHLTGDMVGIVEAMGEKTAMLVGHDWGASVVWNSVLLHPDRFTALAALSVPFGGRGDVAPMERLRGVYKDNFYYQLYFQEPGVAEAEFDKDPRAILSRLYLSPDSPREPPTVTDPKRAAGGWVPRLGAAKDLPPWLTKADLDFYVNEFRRTGFRGGINYYRNMNRNWETTPQLKGATIAVPVRFLAGEQDIVINGAKAEQLTATMKRVCTDFRGVTLYSGAGHWVQQERPAEVNAALIAFLNEVSRKA
jgi:pimeloyl-ACP methyl ester carboxylesterase